MTPRFDSRCPFQGVMSCSCRVPEPWQNRLVSGGRNLNSSRAEIMTVSKSHTMHPQSSLLTIGESVQKESDDLTIPIRSDI